MALPSENELSQRMSSSEDLAEQGALRREAGRIAVRANFRQVMELAYASQARILLGIAYVLVIGMFVALGLSLMNLNLSTEKHKNQCDQPLKFMAHFMYASLLIMYLRKEFLGCFLCYDLARDGPNEPMRVRMFKKLLTLTTLAWPFVTGFLRFQVKECSGYILNAVDVILVYYVVLVVVLIIIPSCGLSVMLCLIRRGLIRLPRDQRAAPEDTIEKLPVVPYDPCAFNDESVDGFSTACPVCLDDFDAENPITCTPCAGSTRGHAFHKECLRGWLNVSRNCPLCRTDLTELHLPCV